MATKQQKQILIGIGAIALLFIIGFFISGGKLSLVGFQTLSCSQYNIISNDQAFNGQQSFNCLLSPGGSQFIQASLNPSDLQKNYNLNYTPAVPATITMSLLQDNYTYSFNPNPYPVIYYYVYQGCNPGINPQPDFQYKVPGGCLQGWVVGYIYKIDSGAKFNFDLQINESLNNTIYSADITPNSQSVTTPAFRAYWDFNGLGKVSPPDTPNAYYFFPTNPR